MIFSHYFTIEKITSVFLFILLVVFLYKYYRNVLIMFADSFVREAELEFKSKEGQRKFNFVMREIKRNLPFLLRIFINERMIGKIIEECLKELQVFFKAQKAKQIAVVEELVKEVDSIDLNIKPSEIKQNFNVKVHDIKQQIDYNGYVEAFADIKTNLKNEHSFNAGVRAGIKM